MTPESRTALNIGELLRQGTRLTAAEAVAVVHAACSEVGRGVIRSVPTEPDQVSVTDDGTLEIERPIPAEHSRAAVASLLEALLPAPTEEADYSVPTALRTLPARLRGSGEGTHNDLKDLLLGLSRYLPSDSADVLTRFVSRVRENRGSAKTEPHPIADLVSDDAVVTDAATDLPLGVPAQPVPLNGHRTRHRGVVIAMFLIALVASGLLGYQLTPRVGEPDAVAVPEASQPAAQPSPGIPDSDRMEASNEALRKLEPPVPLDLTVKGGAFSPSFAADGALLFHAGRGSHGLLFTTTVDREGNATATHALLHDPARNYHPRLSPDGTQLAFDSDREGERAVYLADLRDDRITRVSGPGYAAVPSWSPDGTMLAFIKAEPDRPRVWNLWLLNVARGELQQHTTFRIGQVWGASWFADGSKLVYSHEDRLIVSDLRSGGKTAYVSPVKGRLARTPAISPDSRAIVFQVYRDGVWILDLTTGTMHRVLDDVTAEEFTWDSDGRRIAYHSRRDGEWRIWLLTYREA